LLLQLEETFIAAKRLDRANPTDFQDKKLQFASLDELLKWDRMFRYIELYNSRESNEPVEKRMPIVFGAREQEARVVVNRVVAASVEKYARDLTATFKLNDRTRQLMQPTDSTFIDLERRAKQLFALYPDGKEIKFVHGFVVAVRKKP